MDKSDETFETWNNIASIYQDKFMEMDVYNDTYDYICNAIPKQHAKLLDIGCGPGNITKYLLSQRPDFDIFGIDIAPNMIALAKKNNPSANFAVLDSREISTLTTKFDGIICGFCLPYLSPDESKKLLEDAYSLLHENGLIYLSFVEGDPAKSDFKVGGGGRVFFNFYNLDDLKKQFIDAKFDEIETFKVSFKKPETETDFHTIFTARKMTVK
jgi:SAM-dependent methyltransferase